MPIALATRVGAVASAMIPGVVFVALACGGGSSPTSEQPPSSPTQVTQEAATVVPFASTPAPSPTASAKPSETAAPSTFSADYDATANLYIFFSGPGQTVALTLDALENARREHDKSQAPAILEMIPFFPSSDVVNAATETLVSLTGVDLGGVARQWHV